MILSIINNRGNILDKAKILEIGPSPYKSNGGMATVIKEIIDDKKLNQHYAINFFESYVDGNLAKRMVVSISEYEKFKFIYKKYDVFHIHMASYGSTFRKGYYIRFLKRHNKKVILHVHGAEYLKFFNGLNSKKKRIVENIWNEADYVVVLSDKWKKIFKRVFTNAKIVVINNGIDTNEYKIAQNEIDKFKDKFILLGRLGKRKGIYDVIDAIQKLIDKGFYPRVYLAGDGEVAKVKSIIKNQNLCKYIKVTGWIDTEQKVKLLKETSALLLPSYNEGLPMSILEGMAAGKVIIASNVGAIPEVVGPENGILVSPGDVDKLSWAMERVMMDVDFDRKCSKANIKKVQENYSMDVMHKKIEKLINKVMENDVSN